MPPARSTQLKAENHRIVCNFVTAFGIKMIAAEKCSVFEFEDIETWHPQSWLRFYHHNPCTVRTLIKCILQPNQKLQHIAQDDIIPLLESVTHSQFKQHLPTIQSEERDDPAKDLSVPEIYDSLSKDRFSLTPTIVSNRNDTLEDSIVQLSCPRIKNFLITPTHYAFEDCDLPSFVSAFPEDFNYPSVYEPHMVPKRFGPVYIVYAPPNSGKTTFQQNSPVPSLDTDDVDDWEEYRPVVFTNMPSAIGIGIHHTMIIPSYTVFAERCRGRGIGNEDLYLQWYYGVLRSSLNADVIIYSNLYVSDVLEIYQHPAFTRRNERSPKPDDHQLSPVDADAPG